MSLGHDSSWEDKGRWVGERGSGAAVPLMVTDMDKTCALGTFTASLVARTRITVTIHLPITAMPCNCLSSS